MIATRASVRPRPVARALRVRAHRSAAAVVRPDGEEDGGAGEHGEQEQDEEVHVWTDVPLESGVKGGRPGYSCDVPRSASTSPAPGLPSASARDTARRRQAGRPERWDLPILTSRPGTAPARFAQKLGGRHPVLVFLAAVLTGLLVIGTLSTLLGLFAIHVLLGPLGVGSPDDSVIRTFADHRSGTLTDVSSVGSAVGGGMVLPVLVGLVALVSAATRHWRVAAYALFALATESATYRITTIFVHRDRPHVHRLESLPVNASYPSGHTAASVAVYSGLVLLLTSRLTSSTHRALLWTFAILMTTFVALSRMYRGMHHPVDVAGGVLVGIGAILVVLFACRAAGAAADARAARRTSRTAA